MHRAIIWLSVAIIIAVAVAWFVHTVRAPLKQELVTVKAQASAVQAARVTEQTITKDDAAASKAYQDGLQDGKKELDGVLAKLRIERMRHRSAASASMPNASATAGRCYDEEVADVLDEMARLAGEADDVTRQLTAAQEVLGNRK